MTRDLPDMLEKALSVSEGLQDLMDAIWRSWMRDEPTKYIDKEFEELELRLRDLREAIKGNELFPPPGDENYDTFKMP